MSPRFRVAALLLAFGICAGALGACQSIAGIDDRSLDPAQSPECKDYCAQAEMTCTGTSTLYLDHKACTGTCGLFPRTGDNTLACRMQQLTFAARNLEGDRAMYCVKAGPGGNGNGVPPGSIPACGTKCENYCDLYGKACNKQQNGTPAVNFNLAQCVIACQGLKQNPNNTFNATMAGDYSSDYSGDTLECRIVHTGVATEDPPTHCPHGLLQNLSTMLPNSADPCTDQPETMTDCGDFCTLEMAECIDDRGEGWVPAPTSRVQFDSRDQCMAVCGALPQVAEGVVTGNNVGCRKYHAYNAMEDPDTHCVHTGPDGDGQCASDDLPAGVGNACESYCILLKTGCPGEFSKFPTPAACQLACAKLPGAADGSGYTTTATGNSVQCRLHAVSQALTNLAAGTSTLAQCAAAAGATPCSK